MTNNLTRRVTVPQYTTDYRADLDAVMYDILKRFPGQYITITAKPIKARAKKQAAVLGKIKREKKSVVEARVVALHSRLVRWMAGNRCEIHTRAKERGIVLPFRCSAVMQCCHKYSRAFKAVKFNDKNVYCGCDSGNLWAHHHPDLWLILWREIWPEDAAYLSRIYRVKPTITTAKLLQMEQEYKRELARF